MDNYLGDNYEKLTTSKTRSLLNQYYYFVEQAQEGNITALCIKVDLDNAIEYVLTEREFLCIKEYLINDKKYEDVAKVVSRGHTVIKKEINNALNKITKHLKYGGV